MRIAGTDAATNRSVEIVQVEDGLRLTTTAGAITIPAGEITDFSFDGSDAECLNLAGPVTMQIRPDDPYAAEPVVESIRHSLSLTPDVARSSGGLFDHQVAEPVVDPGDVEDASAYTPPQLPPSALPPPNATPSRTLPPGPRPHRAESVEWVPLQLLLKSLLVGFVCIALIGVVTSVARALTIDDDSITAAERTARFFSASTVALTLAVLTLQSAILVRLVAALRYDEAPRTLPLIGALEPALERASELIRRTMTLVVVTLGLATFASAATVLDNPLGGAFWLAAGLVSASLILALSIIIDQLRSQLDGSIDLGEGHRT